jgi:hypothetical protein
MVAAVHTSTNKASTNRSTRWLESSPAMRRSEAFKVGYWQVRQKTIELRLDYLLTLADSGLHTRAIKQVILPRRY